MNINGSKPKNAPGQKIGRLTILERAGSDSMKHALWKCQCECGTVVTLAGYRLGYNVQSCGCLRREATSKKFWKGTGDIPSSYWNGVVHNAASRNITMNVTIEQVWDLFLKQDKRCALTGQTLTFKSDRSRRYYGTASLDRIDNTNGYNIDNVCWLHKDVNIMKMEHSVQEFINICRLVTAHNKVDPNTKEDDNLPIK